jgi:hypothetical protein
MQMVLCTTKKQNNYPTISQLYHYFTSPTSTVRRIFQSRINQLSSKPYEIGMALARIRDKGILNLENFSLILMHPSPIEIASGLIQLHDSNLLNADNKKALERHTCPSGIALVLRLLQSAKLLTPENRAAIQEKNNPHSVASVLFKLYYANLFTQKNFDSILAYPHLITLNNLLRGFDRQNILTQTMFEQLIHSQQENNSLPHALNKLRKTTILPKQISNLPICPYVVPYTSFFPVDKRRYDQEFHIKTVEINRHICKN